MEATVTAAAAKVFGENHTAIYFTVGLECGKNSFWVFTCHQQIYTI